MSKAELGAGDVPIELDGEAIVLRCSYDAAASLCRAPGGLYSVNGSSSVASRILGADIDTIAFVIRLGLGLGASAVKSLASAAPCPRAPPEISATFPFSRSIAIASSADD